MTTSTLSSASTTEVAGLVPGTWAIDASHSDVSFTVRHLMVSKVRGHFATFEGALEIADNVFDSKVHANIDVNSIDTRDEGRDAHLRSADFFDIENHPTMTFVSTGLRGDGNDYVVEGVLTLKGVSKAVELALEFNGVSSDPWGGTRAGFSASTEINRRDFGVDITLPLDGGGVVVGDKVKIAIEIEAILQAA